VAYFSNPYDLGTVP